MATEGLSTQTGTTTKARSSLVEETARECMSQAMSCFEGISRTTSSTDKEKRRATITFSREITITDPKSMEF